ncbi:hypothetical protein Tco_1419405 [Tanacetum coccineum]
MFLAPTVSSLMAYIVAILTPNSARSCVMQSTIPTKGIRSIISKVSISLKDFLPSILLLMVIIVAVVIVTVIWVVIFVNVIVGVIIVVAIIGVVVVVGGVPSIIDLSFIIVGVPVRLLGLLALDMAAVCASTAVVRSTISCRMASKVMAGVSDVDDELNNVVEEEDGEWICFLGGSSSSGTKKYRGSNSSDGGNTGDEVKIAGGVIGYGDEIEFSEELKELLPDEAGE